MKAEDILPDDKDFVPMQGQDVRKGSVAAFMINCRIIEVGNERSEEYQAALRDIKVQALLLQKIGFFDIFDIKSPRIKQIVSAIP